MCTVPAPAVVGNMMQLHLFLGDVVAPTPEVDRARLEVLAFELGRRGRVAPLFEALAGLEVM